MPCGLVAQEGRIHWAYSAHFGTGRYTLDGVTETVVLGLAPSWTWREAVLGPSGARTIGYRFRVPASIGSTEFLTLDSIDQIDLAELNTVNVAPGVEIEIPMSQRWQLKPVAYLGLGTESRGGVDARTFRIGLRSQLAFETRTGSMMLVNSLERLGYSATDGSSDALNLLSIGLDFSRPLARARIRGSALAIHWHVMYTDYLESLDLDVLRAQLDAPSIGSEWELGAAFGRQEGRLGFRWLRIDRVGLAYRFDTDGDFTGIGITFRSLFDR